jgi:ADP-ribosylglycohydrolase
MDNTHEARLTRARVALEGLSVGDAFGGFYEGGRETYQLRTRTLFSPPWHWTDDTSMALSIYAVLRTHQTIDQDALAKSFGDHFDRSRGHGLGARTLLSQIRAGMDWRVAAPAIFKGGSFGNGGAMRVAPLGAYFADDLALCAAQAALSCEITHSHPEGIAGAVAAAVATGAAASLRGKPKPMRAEFIDLVLPHIPDTMVLEGCTEARDLPAGTTREEAVNKLGNGSLIRAQDTVPFCLWMAGEVLDNYEEALWQTVSALGDADTTCAIVGGIVASYTGIEAIPKLWIERREPLPEWAIGA